MLISKLPILYDVHDIQIVSVLCLYFISWINHKLSPLTICRHSYCHWFRCELWRLCLDRRMDWFYLICFVWLDLGFQVKQSVRISLYCLLFLKENIHHYCNSYVLPADLSSSEHFSKWHFKIFFFYFFLENRLWHFIPTVYLGDNF